MCSSIQEPLKGCHNEASQLQYYKNNLGMVVSVIKHYLRGHSHRMSEPGGEGGLENQDKLGHRGEGIF